MPDKRPLFLFIESNTSGTGAIFAKRAYELGFTPVLIASDPHKYRYADEPWLRLESCDTYNAGALEDLAKRLAASQPIAAVFSSSEYFIAQAAKLADFLGLPGANAGRIEACRDKSVQRRMVAAKGIDDLGFALVGSSAEAALWAAARPGPVVVKPTRGSGSTGVKLCSNKEEAHAHAAWLADVMPDMPILVEDFAPGEEYSVELFDGKVQAIIGKHLGPQPHFVEHGHDFPARIDNALARRIGQFAEACAQALGVDWGPVHVELRCDGQQMHLIEVNPRLAGGFIPVMIRQATGLDLITATILKASHQPFSLDKARHDSAALRFLIPDRSGALMAVTGLEKASAVPGIVSAQLDRALPSYFEVSNDFHDRIGHLIAVHPDQDAACRAVNEAMACIHLRFGDRERGQTGEKAPL